MVHLWAALALNALTVAAVDPDSGIVIDWANLDKIVDTFDPSPPDAWLPPVQENCTMNGVSTLNAGGLDHEVYRPLFCPWFLKPFRDVFDMAVTETAKWPVYRKLMGASNVSTGLPVSGFFGACVCGVYENATRALAALSAYDACWYKRSELARCAAEGHAVPRSKTGLTPAQYAALLKNATYADEATPHL